uniref:Ig-like domain-containing protein n=1 Tax=Cyprinus carpio TaxID=7962 RepID=A0A8C1QP80_CYPCA
MCIILKFQIPRSPKSRLFLKVRCYYSWTLWICPNSVFSTLLSKNIEFIFSVTYNMIEYLRNNSTEHKVVGYTEFGKKLLIASFSRITGKTYNQKSLSGCSVNQKAMLVCSAYDFYPKPIKLMWMRDEMKSGNWYYQIHSHLEYFPKPGEKISCVVEHASSHRPMNYHWDPSLPDSERSKIILGSVGLLMGVFMAAGGLIYYKTHRLVFKVQNEDRYVTVYVPCKLSFGCIIMIS